MTHRSCDASGLLVAFRAGVANLEAQVEHVNAMNVFPVPDGDTGSNMVATARAALAEAERDVQAEAGLTAAAIGLGASFGAQGNSGVIASQIARGMAEALAGRQRIDGQDLARALAQGAETAYAAVVDPVEGTMLTVIRDVADAAHAAADRSNDPVTVLRAAVEAAEASVARTPELLPVLREAGVADAGGEGLYLLLAGALASVDGRAPSVRRTQAIDRPRIRARAAERFGFETLFRLQAAPGTTLDIAAIRAHLGAVGDSVVVAGDSQSATVHVHGAPPDEVLGYAGRLGELSGVSVEDLDRQARVAFDHGPTISSAAGGSPERRLAAIAIVSGDGFVALFESLGATVVATAVSGSGPTLDEVCDAIAAARSRDVVLLPTEPSVAATVVEATRLSNRRVWVVPARNAAEGAAALLAFDPRNEPDVAIGNMTAAAGRIQSFEVSAASDTDDITATLAGVKTLGPGFELITIYYGAAVDRRAAEELGQSIAARLPQVEVETVAGGQPQSLYVIAAE